MLSDIRGLICPLITPFDERGEIDHEAVRHNVEFLRALRETVPDQAAGRAPALIHTGCMTTPRPSS